MNSQTTLPPSICLDLKKNRIRIHRHTLHLLGDPGYIQLLVNPSEGKIAIRRSTSRDHLAHKVDLGSEDCIELYSLYLIENLMSVNDSLAGNRSYRLYGDIDPLSEMASFSMLDPILINE